MGLKKDVFFSRRIFMLCQRHILHLFIATSYTTCLYVDTACCLTSLSLRPSLPPTPGDGNMPDHACILTTACTRWVCCWTRPGNVRAAWYLCDVAARYFRPTRDVEWRTFCFRESGHAHSSFHMNTRKTSMFRMANSHASHEGDGRRRQKHSLEAKSETSSCLKWT